MGRSRAKPWNAQARMLRSCEPKGWRELKDISGVAFSRNGDLTSGEFGDAIVSRSFDEVSSDLSAL